MISGPGAVADGDIKRNLHRHPDVTRPENGMQLRREYGLLASEEPAVDPASAGTQVRGDGHGVTKGTDEQGQTATETGDGTRQRALLARGMPEEDIGEWRPPECQRVLSVCGQQGGEGGRGAITRQRAPTANSQGPEGGPQTRQRARLARP